MSHSYTCKRVQPVAGRAWKEFTFTDWSSVTHLLGYWDKRNGLVLRQDEIIRILGDSLIAPAFSPLEIKLHVCVSCIFVTNLISGQFLILTFKYLAAWFPPIRLFFRSLISWSSAPAQSQERKLAQSLKTALLYENILHAESCFAFFPLSRCDRWGRGMWLLPVACLWAKPQSWIFNFIK